MNKTKWKYHSVAIGVVIGVIAFVFYGLPYIQSKQTQPTIPSKSPPTFPSEIIKPYFSFEEPTTKPIQKPNLLKIIQQKQPKLDPITAKEIAVAVEVYSKKFDFPSELIICLIEQESSFKQMTVSKAGCVGLLQINRKFHGEKLKKLNIKNAEIFYIDNNIHIGVMILREYFDSTGSISGALKKYLGAANTKYMLDILTSFTDLMIVKK